MKSDPSFPKLPSVGELLKHPSVERIVDRVNQTTIAQRASGFLEDLRNHQQKHPGRGVVPSIQQLAERLARQLLGSPEHSAPVVNATGAIWSERWLGPPLADAAVHAMMRLASEYHEADSALHEQVVESLLNLTGAEAAGVGGCFDRAASLAVKCGDGKIDVTRHVGIFDTGEFGLTHVDTIPDRLAAGADLVVCDGAGLLGGPSCGIFVGQRKQVAEVADQLSATTDFANFSTLAALDATLQIYRSKDRVIHRIPALQLLSTPLANLEQRCKRLAPLMEVGEAVAQAVPTQLESTWYEADATKFAGPSWAIKLLPQGDSIDKLANLLREASPRVAGREQEDAVWLNLRPVFPRWDQQLAAAVAEMS